MAEIKNNFTGSKMNQDIDDRLMPNNEYRYALNLEVNRSEASDVGTLQNVLGNSLAINGDFREITGVSDIECIGCLADDSTDSLYLFFTNNTSTAYSSTAKNYIYLYNTKQNASTALVTGAFLNFSTQFPIYGINIVENLLFWTDNRNQPRKINVQKANTQNLTVPTYYSIEEQISVAKLSPFNCPELFRERKAPELSPGEYETTMYDVVSPTLPDGTTNPYYIENWPGDPAYLESRYVRFSYRYKFEDGEYSIMAPFTQIAYIPKQDGFFMYEPPIPPSAEPQKDDETSAYRSTIVSFMQNKVNDILLQIRLPYLPVPVVTPPSTKPNYIPCPANQLYSVYKIVEIEILCKESDELAVNVVDSIPTIPITLSPGQSYFWNTTETVYSYDYPSKKPFKTLPNRDVIRVNDVVPVKALSQEIVGNRVVYGNYQDKHTYPKYLNYNAGSSDKLPFGFNAGEGTSIIEYPNHSVKENRNYQIGVVFGDKFGRESGVILSDKIDSGEATFGASSLYVPYTGEGEITPYDWAGNSLKILFNETISPSTKNPSTGWAGIYNGDENSPDYNPTGWYYYKIVVKQTEQDYYNVYMPGVMAAYPQDSNLELGETSHVVLLNDNINKIPRDLSEVGPSQKQFRSSVILFPRVDNNTLDYKNEQTYPSNKYAFVNTIATNNSLFFPNGVMPTVIPAGFDNFYQIESDPLIARMSTPFKLGQTASTSDVINLAVYETKPTESKLDIYWETSTSGLISDLNIAIQEGSDYSIDSFSGWSFTLSETDGPGTTVTTPIVFKDILGDEIMPTDVIIQSVITETGVDVSSKFVIEKVGVTNKYVVKTAPGAYFYYGFNAENTDHYYFQIQVSIGSPVISNSFVMEGFLTNELPNITNAPGYIIEKELGDIDVYQFEGVNSSNPGGGKQTLDIGWDVYGSPDFTITPEGMLQNWTGNAQGYYNFEVVLTEASGATDSVIVEVNYPIAEGVEFSDAYELPGSPPSDITVSGVVTVIGKPATFYAFASASDFCSVTTELIIDGLYTTVYVIGPGNNSVELTTMEPGTYSYTLHVYKEGNPAGIGNGGVTYTQ